MGEGMSILASRCSAPGGYSDARLRSPGPNPGPTVRKARFSLGHRLAGIAAAPRPRQNCCFSVESASARVADSPPEITV